MKKYLFLATLLSFGVFHSYSQNIVMNYDSLGRINYIFYPDSSSITYTYDNMGNRISAKVHDPCTTKPKPVITALGSTEFCSGDSVMLTSSPGSKYLWSNGDTLQTIKAVAGGDYTVIRLDTFQCSLTSLPLTVIVNPLPVPTIVTNTSPALCSGDSVTLTPSIVGTDYLWSNNETSQSISVNTAGDFSVAVTDANGCTGISSEISVSENPLPSPTVISSGGTVICDGDSVALSSSVVGTSYLWSNGNTTQGFTASVGGDYSVAVTDANGCTGESPLISVVVNPLPVPTVITGGSTTFCTGDSVALSSSITGTDYLWSSGSMDNSFFASESGNYSVSVTDSNGCVGESDTLTVVANPLPSPTVMADGAISLCVGDSVSLSSSIIGIEYLWSNGLTSSSITASGNETYFVSVTDANGCTGISPGLTLTENPLPSPTVIAIDGTEICAGDSTALSSSIIGASYLWSNGLTTQSISASLGGDYSVSVTDANGCTGESSVVTVLVNQLPAPTIVIVGETSFCVGGSVLLESSIVGSDYLWSNNALSESVVISESGSFSVTVTDANGCSGESNVVSIVAHPLPTPTIDTDGGIGFCSGDSLVLSASIIGAEYLWSNGDTSSIIAVSEIGSYSVAVTDANGCEGTSPAIDIVEYTQPTVDAGNAVTVSGGNPTVIGGIPTALGNSPFSYSWTPAVGLDSSNIANPTALPQSTTVYTVVVTDANGCSSIDSITVSVELVTGTVESSGQTGILVYPNPTNDLLTITGSKVENGDYLLELKNVLGQTIFSKRLYVSNQLILHQFSLVSLSSGTYFMTIESGEFRTVTKVEKIN